MAARLCHPTLACHFRQEYLAYPHLLSHKGTFYRGLALVRHINLSATVQEKVWCFGQLL